jgi:hypothetical protein
MHSVRIRAHSIPFDYYIETRNTKGKEYYKTEHVFQFSLQLLFEIFLA